MPDKLRVGCCGLPIGLGRYAQEFSVVEVQRTFYQPPRLGTLEKWKRAVPDDFEFTLKAWQLITHESSTPTYRRLREKLQETELREAGAFRLNETVMFGWQRTLESAHALGSRSILFQCPASFAPTFEHKANLRAFFHHIRGAGVSGAGQAFTLVWEPRGQWRPEEVRELCEELGLVHAVDPFHHTAVSEERGYFRLHGRTGYRYRYTDQDLRDLLEMAEPRAPCYVLFNNIFMLEDSRRFQQSARSPLSGAAAREQARPPAGID